VTPARTADRLDGPAYLLVEPAHTDGSTSGAGTIVAVDAVQAGEGDLVIVSQGSSCRQLNAPDSPETAETAVDALIVGVIDLVDENGVLVFRSPASNTVGGGEA